MQAAILDTSTLSDIRTQRDINVVRRASQYLRSRNQFQFSEVSRYEVRRGYFWNHAWKALERFDDFCLRCVVLPVNREVFDCASELWGNGRRRGKPSADADLIIAATALVNRLPLVTSNTRHFEWIEGLDLLDWRLS
jgi:predicted nucleic acid-binding protein